MTHPSEAFTARAFAELRALERSGPADNDAPLCKGISLSWDDAATEIAVAAVSEPGQLLALEATVPTPTRWFSFNIGLDTATFRAGDVLGLTLDAQGQDGLPPLPLFVRSRRDGDTSDTHLDESLRLEDSRSAVTVLHRVEADTALAGDAAWHTLVLALPKQDFGLTLFDARLFVLPAE